MDPRPRPLARIGELSPSETARPSNVECELEASLLQLLHHHQQISVKLRDHSDKAKKDAIAAGTFVSDLLVDAVNGGVQESFIIQKRIELEIRALSASIVRFAKQTDQWLATSRAINTAVKEIGDFENWMKTMDFDCRNINGAIRNIHRA